MMFSFLHWIGRATGASRCIRTLVAGVLFSGALPAWSGPPAFELLPVAVVDSHGIYLHQIISTPRPELAAIRLADAPAFGQLLSLSRPQVVALLQKAAPEQATNLNVTSGPAQVRVSRRSRPLTETELRELLTATLQGQVVKDRGELELRFSRPWVAIAVPDEPLELKILDLPASGVTPNFIARFELVSGPDRVGPWQLVLQGRLWKDVVVARSNLKRGQPLAEADVSTERRDVISLRDPLDPASLAEQGMELNENVTAGQPVLARSVRQRPVVLRGQLIDALMLDGSLQISLKVEVLADGLPGQTIRVRNPKTKREFHAKVQDEQTVLLN